MRAISDRKLPEPYRSWIDRTAPLPSGVRLLPRTVNVVTDGLFFLLLGVMFGGMGTMFFIGLWQFVPPGSGWMPWVFLGGIGSALWLVPLLLLRRLYFTTLAHLDQKRGALRQGILLGPEGILVRMEPNRCHPIAADRFVVARLVSSANSEDIHAPALIIETLDGKVDFFADRLADTPDAINRAAKELWPRWSKPQPLERADRQRRKDEESPRKMRRAAFLFAGAMLAVFAAIAWVIIVGEDSATTSLAALSVFVGVLLVIGASINLGYRFLTFKLSYRCPQCRSKATRVDEALPAIHYYCPACNIEWDTDLETQRAGLGD